MQRYFSKERIDNDFILSDDDKYHIIKVMRMQTGEKIEVVYANELYICEVYLTPLFKVSICDKVQSEFQSEQKKVLIIPLLKEQKMDLILQKATELGVSKIVPVIMERSIVKLDSKREEKRIERWAKICKEAAEQSKRIDIPTITEIKTLKDLKYFEGLKVVCSTTEKNLTLKKFLTTNKNYDKINIVIGPEGGISPKEENLLENIGFIRVSLGNRIMRVETVPMFVLSVLNYENME